MKSVTAWGPAVKEKSSANRTIMISMKIMRAKRKTTAIVANAYCKVMLNSFWVFSLPANPWQALAVAAGLRNWQSSTH